MAISGVEVIQRLLAIRIGPEKGRSRQLARNRHIGHLPAVPKAHADLSLLPVFSKQRYGRGQGLSACEVELALLMPLWGAALAIAPKEAAASPRGPPSCGVLSHDTLDTATTSGSGPTSRRFGDGR